MQLEELMVEALDGNKKQTDLLSFFLREWGSNILLTDAAGQLCYVGSELRKQLKLADDPTGKRIDACFGNYGNTALLDPLLDFIRRKITSPKSEAFLHNNPLGGQLKVSFHKLESEKYQGLWLFNEFEWTKQPTALSEVLEEAGIVLQSVDTKGNITYVNKAWKELLGYPDEMLNSLNILEIVHPNELEHCKNLLQELGKGGKDSEKAEIVFRAYDGNKVVLSGTISVQKNPLTGEQETRSLFYDVTRRRRAEKALKDSEANFRFLAENIDQVLFLRSKAEVQYVSPSFEHMFGGSVDELYDDWGNYFKYIHPEDRPRIVPFVREAYDSRGYEQQYRIVHKKGFVRWVWVKAFTFNVDEDGPSRTVGIIIDITNQKYAEERLQNAKAVLEKSLTEEQKTKEKLVLANKELRRAQSQLVHSEKMASLGTLTAGIAHEINNPINFVINGSIALENYLNRIMLILDDFDSFDKSDLTESGLVKWEQLQEHKRKNQYDRLRGSLQSLISDVRIGADRTVHIVKGLRNFARTDEEELKKADVHEGIDSTLTLLNHLINSKVEVKKSYLLDPPIITHYPGQLNQVFMNLLTNAIQAFDREGGVIEIKTYHANNNAVIEIIDNGKGIPEKIREKIFEPFFTTKEVGEGTGMGLAISYAILQKHKGEITVASESGKGTKFTIKIPANLH